ELDKQFHNILLEYAKWVAWQIQWQEIRNSSIKALEFPFAYREGQAELVKGVYQSILRKKRLYIEAPTGVGKTVSTVFPS
ncbi:ATP-dependent DNA helicase, partial [Klebsiella oxytoca]